jgi:predicted HTH domain antitoxin
VTITVPDEFLSSAGLTEEELKCKIAIALFSNIERLTLAKAARLADQTQLNSRGH